MILVVFILGLIFGSFINALVWRVHSNRKWWGNERSICPNCKHVLAPKDLLPVLSWLWLRGRCRYCSKTISKQYPLVELLTGLMFAISYMFWPYSLAETGFINFILWLPLLISLIALAVYDFKWMLLPNRMVATAGVFAGIFVVSLELFQTDNLLNSIMASIVLFALFWGLFQISGGKWIGGGDVKLVPVLGLIAGTPVKSLLIVFIASLLGTIIVLPFLAMGRSKMTAKIPFGPYLIVATVIVFLFGQKIIDWYLNSLMY